VARGFYRIVTDELIRLGFERIRGGKGSHEKWRSVFTQAGLIVPRNLKSRHTANGILKDAGSDKRL
jgi:predicted RNA binding protein YcfA (HicA-like mRNA interferase family)